MFSRINIQVVQYVRTYALTVTDGISNNNYQYCSKVSEKNPTLCMSLKFNTVWYLRQIGEDNHDVLASHGWVPSNRIWDTATLRSKKQQIWLSTTLCGGCCWRMVIRNLRVACQKRRWRWMVLFLAVLFCCCCCHHWSSCIFFEHFSILSCFVCSGSSSMASACAGSLALLDAGILCQWQLFCFIANCLFVCFTVYCKIVY